MATRDRTGTTKFAFAITEADAGTNSHNLATSLRREGDRYVLNGQKMFISGVEDADAVLVVARDAAHDGKLGLPTLRWSTSTRRGSRGRRFRWPYGAPTSSGRCSSTMSSSRLTA